MPVRRCLKISNFVLVHRTMKKIVISVLVLVLILVSVILIRTFTFASKQVAVDAASRVNVSDSALAHFAGAISFKTVSYGDALKFDSSQFLGFRQYLEANYPIVHNKLNRE